MNLECHGPKGISFIYDKLAAPIKTQGQTQTTVSEKAPGLLSSTPKVCGFDVYICYTQGHLIRDGLILSTLNNINAADLVPCGTAVASRQVSHQAIMSFATILFGIQHRQADITRQGYAMYGVALKQLNQLLSDTTRQSHDEIIVTVAALSVSELLLPSGPNNYLTHMKGLERLMALQDPVSFWSSKSSGFCNGVRFMILLASFRLRKPSILAKADWKKAMRMKCSDQELREQDLFDVLADCSVLIAERDSLLSAGDTIAISLDKQRDDIERRAISLLNFLYEWRRRWDLENVSSEIAGCSLGFEESQPISDEDPEQLIATTAIPSVAAAMELMLYNLAVLHVLQVITTLPLEGSVHLNTLQLETANECRAKERIAARELCRCIQYYLCIKRCRLDARASPISHWAVSTTWKALRCDESIEGEWIRDLLCKKNRQLVADGLWTSYLWLNSLPEQAV